MAGILEIPQPVKVIFEKFPLEAYAPVGKADDAVKYESEQRTYPFVGSTSIQNSINETFKLGVYNVFRHKETGSILATDPWCLYTQLALCKKNSLSLCTGEEKKRKNQHSMVVLSHSAATDARLPVLVEGYSKRYVRSTEGINEILSSRVTDAKDVMYLALLDTVVYDCWISQVVYNLSTEKLLDLYHYKPHQSRLLDKLVLSDLKSSLIKRNEFHLRHLEVAKNIESLSFYKAKSIDELTQPLLQNCQKVLLQFQKLLGDRRFYSENVTPSYLDLKLASYTLCIMNLDEDVALYRFVVDHCDKLVQHANYIVDIYKKV